MVAWLLVAGGASGAPGAHAAAETNVTTTTADNIVGVILVLSPDSTCFILYDDFRAGWQEGIKASKSMGLYRQQYCGCIYSEKDRYHPSRNN